MIRYQREKKVSESSSVNSDLDISVDFRSSTSEIFPPDTRMMNGWKNSEEKKEEIFGTATLEALSQLEDTITMSSIVESKNKKILEMEMEIKALKKELREKQSTVVEFKSINDDLMEKLQYVTNANSRQKIDLENLRTDVLANNILESPVTPESSYSAYLKDICENREKLLEENVQLLETIDDQRKHIFSLESYVAHMEASLNGECSDFKHIEETTIEDRSTSDLLAIIRRHMDEKIVWMEYAIKLTQQALEQCPQLFDIDTTSSENSLSDQNCNLNKCPWAKLAIVILEKISHSSPQLLRDIVKSADPNQINHIDLNLK